MDSILNRNLWSNINNIFSFCHETKRYKYYIQKIHLEYMELFELFLIIVLIPSAGNIGCPIRPSHDISHSVREIAELGSTAMFPKYQARYWPGDVMLHHISFTVLTIKLCFCKSLAPPTHHNFTVSDLSMWGHFLIVFTQSQESKSEVHIWFLRGNI